MHRFRAGNIVPKMLFTQQNVVEGINEDLVLINEIKCLVTQLVKCHHSGACEDGLLCSGEAFGRLGFVAGRARGNSICIWDNGTKGAVAVGAVKVAMRDGGHSWKVGYLPWRVKSVSIFFA